MQDDWRSWLPPAPMRRCCLYLAQGQALQLMLSAWMPAATLLIADVTMQASAATAHALRAVYFSSCCVFNESLLSHLHA
jgi:hypothetical protein